jgi:hypothetical protein
MKEVSGQLQVPTALPSQKDHLVTRASMDVAEERKITARKQTWIILSTANSFTV